MTVADADRDLCRLGRRLSPSHDIDCEYRVDLRARVLTSVRRFQVLGNRPEEK